MSSPSSPTITPVTPSTVTSSAGELTLPPELVPAFICFAVLVVIVSLLLAWRRRRFALGQAFGDSALAPHPLYGYMRTPTWNAMNINGDGVIPLELRPKMCEVWMAESPLDEGRGLKMKVRSAASVLASMKPLAVRTDHTLQSGVDVELSVLIMMPGDHIRDNLDYSVGVTSLVLHPSQDHHQKQPDD